MICFLFSKDYSVCCVKVALQRNKSTISEKVFVSVQADMKVSGTGYRW